MNGAASPVLGTPALLWMALACGLCAGGNYFNQPLLHSIAQHFGVDQGMAAL
ncbi:MAG: MFS transporter, partial [Comamonas sp.]